MRFHRSLCTDMLLPAVLWGGMLAICLWLVTGSALACLAALAAALGTAGVNVVWSTWKLNTALAGLRHPQFSPESSGTSGMWEPLVQEARRQLATCESRAAAAVEDCSRIAAEHQVRRRASTQMELALHAMNEPLIICDTTEQVRFANRSARQFLAAAGGTALAGQPADGTEDSVILSHVPALAELVTEAVTRQHTADRRTVELSDLSAGAEQTPAGESSPQAWRATACNLRTQHGEHLGVALMLTDATRQHHDRTRHAEFVSSVCHELKTPLSSIRAFTEMLIDGEVDSRDEQLEVLGFIDTQAERLARICTSMLNLARIESGVIQVQRVDAELNDILNRALHTVGPAAQEKQITLVPELSGLYLPVHIDPDLFGQAILNLLSNAIKYTASGGEVRLRSRMDEGTAVIEVHDNGMGIPEDSLPRLLDRFYRVPENSQAASGTGLGLALVHCIVAELHNGQLTIQSVVGEGSCFTISIPLGHLRTAQRKQASTLPVR